MTRQLVDVLADSKCDTLIEEADWLVQLLQEGPAEHSIVCPTCEGRPASYPGRDLFCPDCTNGRRRVIITASLLPPLVIE